MNLQFLLGAVVGFAAVCGAFTASALITTPEKPYAEMSEAEQHAALHADFGGLSAAMADPNRPGVTTSITFDAKVDRVFIDLSVDPALNPVALWQGRRFKTEETASLCQLPVMAKWIEQGVSVRTRMRTSDGETALDITADRVRCFALQDSPGVPSYLEMEEADQSEFMALTAEALQRETAQMPLVDSVTVHADAQTDHIHIAGRMSRSLDTKQLAVVRSRMPDSAAACLVPSFNSLNAHGIRYSMTVTDLKDQMLMDIDCRPSSIKVAMAE